MLRREDEDEEEAEGDLQTCTSIHTLNLVVIQAICAHICDMELEVLRVMCVHLQLGVLHHEKGRTPPQTHTWGD